MRLHVATYGVAALPIESLWSAQMIGNMRMRVEQAGATHIRCEAAPSFSGVRQLVATDADP